MASLNTPYATLAFVHAFKPKARVEGQEPVYSCVLLFAPDQQKSPAYKAMQEACYAAAQAEFGANVDMKKVVFPFRNAGDKEYDGFEPDHTYINTWSKNKPGVVDVNRQDILIPEEVWSGQLVRANVSPFAWQHSGKRGVSLGWNALQVIQSEGRARIDGRVAASRAFDDGLVSSSEESIF